MFGLGKRKESVEWQDESIWGGGTDVHTSSRPYCDDLSCWCHTDVTYHAQVTEPLPVVTDDQLEQAYNVLGVLGR